MAVASPSPVKILSDLGYEIWEIENDADLRSALIEAINTLSMGNPSDQRIPILQEAVKNIKRSKFKERIVNVDKLMNRKASSAQQISPEKLLPAASDDGGDNNETIVTGGLAKRLDNIANSLDSLRRALKQQFNLDKQVAAQSKIDEAEADKKEREGQLEKGKGKGKAIVGGVTKTVTKPFSGFFNTLINYFKNIVLGSALLGLVNWLKDPANEEKIKAFSQFLQDTLPALIGGIVDHVKNNWQWYAAGAGIVGLLSLGGAVSGLVTVGKALLAIGGFFLSVKGILIAIGVIATIGLFKFLSDAGKEIFNANMERRENSIDQMVEEGMDRGTAETLTDMVGVEGVDGKIGPGPLFPDTNMPGDVGGQSGSGLCLYARGGRPPLGKVALVGEEGPELFVPDQSGTIINNDNFQDMVKKINETQIDGEEPVVAFAPKLIMMSKIDTPLTSRKSDPQIIDLRNNVQQQAANAVEGGSSVPSFSSKSGASEFVAASTLNIGNV